MPKILTQEEIDDLLKTVSSAEGQSSDESADSRKARFPGGTALAAVEQLGRDPPRVERLYLVLHQGDQRRDHQSKPALHHRGHLKAD